MVQKLGAVLFGQEDLRREMMPAGGPANTTTGAMALPMVTYKYDPTTGASPPSASA